MRSSLPHSPAAGKSRAPLSPQAIIALGFLAIILIIAALLMLPVSSASGEWTGALTALFTATSAVCVTGLVVVDTAAHWSLFGKLVLLLAIQIGGLGVMTVFSLAALLFHRRIGLRQRTLLRESVSALHTGSVVRIVRRALLGTAVFELAGAAALCVRFVPLFGLRQGVFFALFHSVSAFCNAGFDLMGLYSGPFSSLEAFSGDPLVCVTAIALILLGGLGFFVWDDLIEQRFRWRRLALHTRVVLLVSAALLTVPTALFFLFEKGASMQGMDIGERLLASAFSAVTPRTAGFDTVPTASLSPAGSLLTLMLMFTGGNPGSTAGGAKTTTVLVMLLLAVSTLRREEDAHLLRRRIGPSLIRRASAVVVIYMTLAMGATLALCAAQPSLALGDVLIEVFSAVNTVGMSTGITRALSPFSRVAVMLLMYAGRLGSLTFALLVFRHTDSGPVRRPEGQLLIG